MIREGYFALQLLASSDYYYLVLYCIQYSYMCNSRCLIHRTRLICKKIKQISGIISQQSDKELSKILNFLKISLTEKCNLRCKCMLSCTKLILTSRWKHIVQMPRISARVLTGMLSLCFVSCLGKAMAQDS